MKISDRSSILVDKIVSSINNYSDLKTVKKIVDSVIEPVLSENDYTLDKGSKIDAITGSEYGGSARAFASGGREKTFRYIIEVRNDIPEDKKKNILYHEFVHLVQMINVAIRHGDQIKNEYKYSWLDLETIAKAPKNYKGDKGYYKDTQEIAAHAYETAARLKAKAKEIGVDPKELLTKEGIEGLDDAGLKYYMKEAEPKVRKHFIKLVSEALTKTSSKTAKLGVSYDYSSSQIALDPQFTDFVQNFIKEHIDENDLDTENGNGVEDQTHVTLLYGILEAKDDGRLEKAVKESGLKTISFEGLGKFSNETDVLIIKVNKSKELMDTEKRLRELYPDNENSYSEYVPHCTIAYLKTGRADKYIEKFNDLFKGKVAKIDAVEFSAKDKGGITRHKIAAPKILEKDLVVLGLWVSGSYTHHQGNVGESLKKIKEILKLKYNTTTLYRACWVPDDSSNNVTIDSSHSGNYSSWTDDPEKAKRFYTEFLGEPKPDYIKAIVKREMSGSEIILNFSDISKVIHSLPQTRQIIELWWEIKPAVDFNEYICYTPDPIKVSKIASKIAATEEEFVQLVCNYVEKNYLKFQVTDKKTLGYKEIIAKLEANLNITEDMATLIYPIVEQRVQLTLNKQGFKQALKKLLNGPTAKKHEPKLSSFAEDIHVIFQKIKKPIREAAKKDDATFISVLTSEIQKLKPVVGLNKIDIDVVDTPDIDFLGTARLYRNDRWMILDVNPKNRMNLNTFEGWNQFQDEVEEFMSHEFQHQVDYDEDKAISDKEYEEARSEGYYYELPDEMHAFSRQAASELRNKGYTDSDILDLIDNNKFIELANNSSAFNTYIEYKDEDPELYEDFTKLVINHIKKDTNKFMSKKSSLLRKRSDVKQEYDSAATSLDQIAAVFKKVSWKPDTVNVDYGGGRFDKATNYLKEQGVENLVYDPFNRSSEHNATVISRLKERKADTGTLANVLNVIKEKDVRLSVLHELKSLVKPGGEVYISVYFDPKQKAKPTSKGWQNHLPLAGYLDEISSVFNSVRVSNGMVIAKA